MYFVGDLTEIFENIATMTSFYPAIISLIPMFFLRPKTRSRVMQAVPQAQDLQAFLTLLPENDRPAANVLDQELQQWVNTSLYGTTQGQGAN